MQSSRYAQAEGTPPKNPDRDGLLPLMRQSTTNRATNQQTTPSSMQGSRYAAVPQSKAAIPTASPLSPRDENVSPQRVEARAQHQDMLMEKITENKLKLEPVNFITDGVGNMSLGGTDTLNPVIATAPAPSVVARLTVAPAAAPIPPGSLPSSTAVLGVTTHNAAAFARNGIESSIQAPSANSNDETPGNVLQSLPNGTPVSKKAPLKPTSMDRASPAVPFPVAALSASIPDTKSQAAASSGPQVSIKGLAAAQHQAAMLDTGMKNGSAKASPTPQLNGASETTKKSSNASQDTGKTLPDGQRKLPIAFGEWIIGDPSLKTKQRRDRERTNLASPSSHSASSFAPTLDGFGRTISHATSASSTGLATPRIISQHATSQTSFAGNPNVVRKGRGFVAQPRSSQNHAQRLPARPMGMQPLPSAKFQSRTATTRRNGRGGGGVGARRGKQPQSANPPAWLRMSEAEFDRYLQINAAQRGGRGGPMASQQMPRAGLPSLGRTQMAPAARQQAQSTLPREPPKPLAENDPNARFWNEKFASKQSDKPAGFSNGEKNVMNGGESAKNPAADGKASVAQAKPVQWTAQKPRSHNVASRWVELSNLPDTFGPRDVTALVWGGAVEQVRYTPRASTAKIGFVSAACCANYHEQTASDIEYDFRMIKVEMIRDVPEPMTLEVMGHLQNGATRCVVATGPREDLTVGDIKKLAKEDGRQVEHVSIGRDTQGVRENKFRFCNIVDAVSLYDQLRSDPGWRMCTINYLQDPCQKASGVHS